MKNTISMVIITSAIEDSYPDAKVWRHVLGCGYIALQNTSK
nr:hypothetical protein [uncultured Providencia sp.]